MPKIITSAFLKTHRACNEQRDLFTRLYPEGAELVPGSIIRAAEQGLDAEWLRRFLSAPALRAYCEATAPSRRAFDEATAAADRAYIEARAAARRVYEEARAPAWCAFDEAMAPAWRAYCEATARRRRAFDEAMAPAWRAYNIACAPILEKHLSELIAA